jgi:hypothetical protein
VCWMPIKNAHNRFNDWFYLLRPELKNKLWHRNSLPNRTNICALAHGKSASAWYTTKPSKWVLID